MSEKLRPISLLHIDTIATLCTKDDTGRYRVGTLADYVVEEIEKEIRPGTKDHEVYNCCGCSTYDTIIDDIEALIRRVLDLQT